MKDTEQIIQDNLNYTLFPWSKQKIVPLVIERANGVYLYEPSGKRYLDFSSQLVNMNIGHGDSRVSEAIMKQMQMFSHLNPAIATAVRGRVGKALAKIAPKGLTKTFFTLGGAEAIENAIKIARMYSGKHKIIARYRAYHGATYGAMTAGGDPRKLPADSQQMPGVIHVEDPYCYRCPWGQQPNSCHRECVQHIERIIEFEGPKNIAAILMEGESGSSGCIKYPLDYWQQLRKIADKYNILLICDEIMSGFGRTGEWFGISRSGVSPDIMCFAKGLTCGYLPLGGVMVSDTIAHHFDENPLMIGLTYAAHPVSLAAAEAVLQIYESDKLIENTRNIEQFINQEMEKLSQKHLSIGDFRNTGLLGCIELVTNRKTKQPLVPFNTKPEEMGPINQIAAKLKELGLYAFVRWNYIFIAPPLTITQEQASEGLQMISQALEIADSYYKE
ncbi:MAG: aminotransferase class III-fold pyridoxal phosphate-dependent enzyme [Bacteroidia bacterium]|nr:aminotransferase class III-fold pyridoxal phosphate-dependent enzyme [Bacteroidia bacterium]